jgi:hypothetical protein
MNTGKTQAPVSAPREWIPKLHMQHLEWATDWISSVDNKRHLKSEKHKIRNAELKAEGLPQLRSGSEKPLRIDVRDAAMKGCYVPYLHKVVHEIELAYAVPDNSSNLIFWALGSNKTESYSQRAQFDTNYYFAAVTFMLRDQFPHARSSNGTSRSILPRWKTAMWNSLKYAIDEIGMIFHEKKCSVSMREFLIANLFLSLSSDQTKSEVLHLPPPRSVTAGVTAAAIAVENNLRTRRTDGTISSMVSVREVEAAIVMWACPVAIFVSLENLQWYQSFAGVFNASDIC